jgi:ABC-type dipeptide/oligopeptide/nickel transport system ATPase component
MRNLLEVEDLSLMIEKQEGWITPLKSVSLKIGYSQTVGLVGESGSGKSLTAKAILKLFPHNRTRLSAKKLQLGNIDLLHAGDKLLQKVRGAQIGWIMQDAQSCLNPTMRIKHQITESLLYHEIFSSQENAEEEARRLLNLVEIPSADKVLNCYPFELSGGMKQRVVIATAIATRPKLIIADEPTSALDIEAQDATLDLLKTIQQEFMTSILLITHDLHLAKSFCDHIAVMYQGKTIETLSKKQFLMPCHPYTRHLMMSKPTLTTPKDQLLPTARIDYQEVR